MNSYSLNYFRDVDIAKATAGEFLSAVTIGSILSPNFKMSYDGISPSSLANVVVNFNFDLPFSLSNLNIEPVAYDTRFQNVKEFIDKPYAVAGRVVSILLNRNEDDVYDVKKDFDDYIVYKNVYFEDLGQETEIIYDLYIGIVNSTLTETYAPFGAVAGAVGNGIAAMKIYDTKDLRKALAQANCSKAGSLSGVSMTASLPNYQSPPFNPNLSLTETLNR